MGKPPCHRYHDLVSLELAISNTKAIDGANFNPVPQFVVELAPVHSTFWTVTFRVNGRGDDGNVIGKFALIIVAEWRGWFRGSGWFEPTFPMNH